MKVYLAGPIAGTTDAEMHDWRTDLKRRMPNIEFVDPADRDYRGTEDTNIALIVEADKHDIDGSDVVVAYCPRPSVGTSMEVLYAWERRTPVLLYAPPGSPVSPWLTYHSHATYQYPTEVESALLCESLRA